MSARVTVIPTTCPRFHAACATVGIPLEQFTPGVSNVYSNSEQWKDKGAGDITYFMSQSSGLNPLAIAEIWLDPTDALRDAVNLPQVLIGSRTADELRAAGDLVAEMTIRGAAAHMSLFCSGKYKLPSLDLTDDERSAVQKLDLLPQSLTNSKAGRSGAKAAAILSDVWKPAMVAWVKAWVYNYRELRDVWQSARPALKIERENQLPLIIPKGPQFAQLLRRWT